MVNVELNETEALGLIALATLGLTHNYASIEDKEVRLNQKELYLESVEVMRAFAQKDFEVVINKIDEIRNKFIESAPAETEGETPAE